jgi:cell division protein FtsL
MNTKYSINLLQPELLPKKPPLTLNKVLIVWSVVALLMFAAFTVVQTKLHLLNKENHQLTVEKNKNDALLSQLEQQIKQHRKNPELIAQLNEFKTLLKYKNALKSKLTDESSAYVAGFSGAMTELAEHYQSDVSLQHVMIDSQHMTFSGIAKTPDAVPLWLAGFKQSTFLSGMSFSHFKLTENKHKITEFVVSSKIPEAGIK